MERKYKSFLYQNDSFKKNRDTLFKKYENSYIFIIISPDKTYNLFHKQYPKNIPIEYVDITEKDEYPFYHEKYDPKIIENIMVRYEMLRSSNKKCDNIVILFDDSITKIDSTLLKLILDHRSYCINLIISCNNNSLKQIIENDNIEKQKIFENLFFELIY